MIDFGMVRPGTTLYIPFHTFDSNDPSASVTLTGLAVTDVEVYKNGSVTQRASDNGYALLDTDGIDFDSTTGIHGISIDLADNTTAGFWSAGAQYWVVIASITVDAATINFIAATFRIGYPDAILNTTIATLSSQTSFTLSAGSADNSAYVGCPVLVHDVASGIQVAAGVISAYTGSTKTVTLAADPGIFTMAATDNISVFMPSNTRWAGTTLWGSGAITAGSIASNAISAAKIATDAITAAKIAADAIGSSELATTAVNEIRDAILSDSTAFAGANIGAILTDSEAVLVDSEAILVDTEAILADTNELQTDWTDAGRLDAILDALLVDTEASQTSEATIITDTEALLVDTEAIIVDSEAILADTELWTTAHSEPAGVPAADETPLDKLAYVFMGLRNQVTVTATKKTFFDDSGAAEWEKDLSDDGTTYTETEGNAI